MIATMGEGMKTTLKTVVIKFNDVKDGSHPDRVHMIEYVYADGTTCSLAGNDDLVMGVVLTLMKLGLSNQRAAQELVDNSSGEPVVVEDDVQPLVAEYVLQ
jgi:hypothetical protein